MAATLKRLRLRAYCCPHSASSRCLSINNAQNPWHMPQTRQFSSTATLKYPPPSSKGGDGPVIGENVAPERTQPGFWSMGEESDDLGGDEDFEGNDLTATGHAELDAHRELREFARIAAWEMPLLSSTKHSKPLIYTHTHVTKACHILNLQLHRARQTLHPTHQTTTAALPLHNLPPRAAPRRRQSRPRILPVRSALPLPRTNRQTHQARRGPIRPCDADRQDVVRRPYLAARQQSLAAEHARCAASGGARPGRHVRGCAV